MQQEIKPKGNIKIYLGNALMAIFTLRLVIAAVVFADLYVFVAALDNYLLAAAGIALIIYGNKEKWQTHYKNLILLKKVSSIRQLANITGGNYEAVKKSVIQLYFSGKLFDANVNINFDTDQITYNNF